MEKVIQKNNPYPDAGGQYNYEDGEFPGKEYSSTGTEELYSIVTESSINKNILSSYPYLWPYKGMKIVIDRIVIQKERYLYDSDPGNDEGTLNVLLDAYFYDESSFNYFYFFFNHYYPILYYLLDILFFLKICYYKQF